ncbi:hypothetical protein KKF61_04595 [Patescibacteria group bacterium]|nr:hypothetical protein [Patescibacteria group bacterium]
MIPTADFMYNYDYAKRLYKGDGDFEDIWRRIVGLGADFEKIYEEYIGRILKSIEKYSGYSWESQAEEFLQIYVVDSAPSFAHPLTLSISDDPVAMLEDFIYQLANRNMYFGFKTDELKKKCLKLVVDYVMQDLDLKKVAKSDWDLYHKTIKQYLRK